MLRKTMWALAALILMMAGPAWANNHKGIDDQIGVLTGQPVAALGMNQLPAYRAIQPAVLAAADHYRDDAVVASLTAFIAKQDAAMRVFGLIDYQAWTAEEHPQHPPIHGVLSGTAALLNRLAAIAPDDPAVTALTAARGLNPALQELCTSALPVDVHHIRTVTMAEVLRYHVQAHEGALRLGGLLLLALGFTALMRRLFPQARQTA